MSLLFWESGGLHNWSVAVIKSVQVYSCYAHNLFLCSTVEAEHRIKIFSSHSSIVLEIDPVLQQWKSRAVTKEKFLCSTWALGNFWGLVRKRKKRQQEYGILWHSQRVNLVSSAVPTNGSVEKVAWGKALGWNEKNMIIKGNRRMSIKSDENSSRKYSYGNVCFSLSLRPNFWCCCSIIKLYPTLWPHGP